MRKPRIKRKLIYFHIDEYSRDAITASVLKLELEKKGWTLIYGNRFTARVLRYFEWIFDAVILPKPHFMQAIFEYEKIPKLQSKYVMLYTENIGIIADDTYPKMVLKGVLDKDFMEGRKNCVEKVSAFCFWGQKVSNVISNEYPELSDRCYVVGHPRHDRRAIDRSLTYSSDKTIGLISRYCTLNDYILRSPLETLVKRYIVDDIYEYRNDQSGDSLKSERRGDTVAEDLYIEAVDVKNTILLIRKLINSGYKVSFKVHPRENYEAWISIMNSADLKIDIADPRVPFPEWALQQRCVIGPPSTCFYDSLMLGIYPISMSGLDKKRSKFINKMYEENNKLMDHIIAPDSIDKIVDLVQHVSSLKLPVEAEIVLKSEADYPECCNSVQKVGAVLEKILSVSSSTPRKRKFYYYIYTATVCLLSYIGSLIESFRPTTNSSKFYMTKSVVSNIDRMACENKVKEP